MKSRNKPVEDNPGRMTAKARISTLDQVSAGGVAFRKFGSRLKVVLIAAKPSGRWQLPKGLIDGDETPEEAALREVREEAGVETDLIAPIEMIEYWYSAKRGGEQVRYHKFVHFFLLAYRSGDVSDSDHEVIEARWMSFGKAIEMLAFKSERAVVEKAREMISALSRQPDPR